MHSLLLIKELEGNVVARVEMLIPYYNFSVRVYIYIV